MLDAGVAHCNHGSFGAVTRKTSDAVAAARRGVEANPAGFFAREFAPAYRRAVAAATAFVGAPQGSVALTGNATEGIDLALRLAKLGPDDVVVTTAESYPAVTANVAGRCAASGARHVRVGYPLGATDDEVVAAVLAGAEAATVMVVDHIASPTGRLLPVERLVPALRARGVLTIVDGAHAPGQIPVDLASLRPDVWFGNVHKWACGPKSLAIVYVDEAHHWRTPPLLASADSGGSFPDNAAWTGTRDPGPMLVLSQVLAAAAAWLHPAVRQEVASVAAGWQSALCHALGVSAPLYPTAWMRCVPLPGVGPARAARAELAATLARDLGVEAAVTACGAQALLRLSAHVYSRGQDITPLMEGLDAVLPGTA